MDNKEKSILWGLIASVSLLLFFILIVGAFQGIEFAFLNLRSLWYLIFPLIMGFGYQIYLFNSIRYMALTSGVGMVAGTGTISAGSMIACCSHFLLNMIPIVGASGLALFLTKYQSWFLVVGIISNSVGIISMLRHKKGMMRSMKFNKEKGGKADCCK